MKFLGYLFLACILFGLGYATCYFGWFDQLMSWVTSLIG